VKPRDLLDQAEQLANSSARRPRRAELCRAISAAYYAVFHALCRSNADAMAGTGSNRPHKAWLQVYRAVDHGQAKKRCKSAASKGFPTQIVNFADAFVNLQELRHRADYDPEASFKRSQVVNHIGVARSAVNAIRSAPIRDRRAFAIHILLAYRE
jgi:hypothetical protein